MSRQKLKLNKTMFTIKVIEQNTGRPAYYKKVSIRFKGLLKGFAEDQYTDKNGEVHFDYDNGDGTIYIEGKVYKECYLSGKIPVYI